MDLLLYIEEKQIPVLRDHDFSFAGQSISV